MHTPSELTELFRERGLKVTPQRQRIFEVLHGNGAHPSAEAVYDVARATMPTMSLKTVYQTLNDLADLAIGVAAVDVNHRANAHLLVDAIREGNREVGSGKKNGRSAAQRSERRRRPLRTRAQGGATTG